MLPLVLPLVRAIDGVIDASVQAGDAGGGQDLQRPGGLRAGRGAVSLDLLTPWRRRLAGGRANGGGGRRTGPVVRDGGNENGDVRPVSSWHEGVQAADMRGSICSDF